MASPSSRRTAYTLLELVLVLAIIIIIGAVAYPSIEASYGYFKVQAAADAVKGAWAQARERAIRDGIPYRFAVIPGTNHFRLAPDSPDFWTGTTPDAEDPTNPPLVIEKKLPKGIVFTPAGQDAPPSPPANDNSKDDEPVDPTAFVTLTVFLPNGTAQNDVSIRLEAKGASPLTVRLRSLTGTFRTLTAKEAP